MYKLLGTAFSLFMLLHQASGQYAAAADTIAAKRMSEISDYYHGLMAGNSFLYSGREYSDYPPTKGHAYYENPGWYVGSVTYDGIEYRNIFLKYDLVKDQVVVQRPDNLTKLSLQNRLVTRFTLGDQNFIRLQTVDQNGDSLLSFHEVLVPGPLTLLAKTQKEILEKILDMELIRLVKEKTSYYAYKDGRYHHLKNQSSLYEILPGHRKQMEQYLRQQRIVYKLNPRQALIILANYYNQITR